jgi:outer membrane protein assembly factor BamD
MKFIQFILGLSFLSLMLSSCTTSTPSPENLYPGQSEAKIYADGKESMLKGNYEEAIHHFENITSVYPFGEYAQKSQLNLIYSYYKKDNFPLALAAADQYIRLYPRGENIDYAYYMRGIVQFEENKGVFERFFKTDFAKRDLTGLKKAYIDFNRLQTYFPKSQYTPYAKRRLIYIRNTLALHELQVAQFYYERQSYVAAANRANEVVQHYQGAPQVPQALVLMVKSYQKLGLTKDADESLRILKLNFPQFLNQV